MKQNKRVFSKALFKQSCKANGAMWIIITIAVCFMLCCVMLISGTSGISTVKEGIEDTIIKESVKAEIKKDAIKLYDSTDDAEYIFDVAFAKKINELNTKENYQKIKVVKDKAEKIVEDEVTRKVKEDIEDVASEDIEQEVTSMVKDKVTEKVTEKVTARVTELIKQETTNRVSQDADVIAKVTTYMTGAEGTQKITDTFLEKLFTLSGKGAFATSMTAPGATQDTAIATVVGAALSTYNTDPYAYLTNEAYSSIATQIGSGTDATTAIGNTVNNLKNEAIEEIKVYAIGYLQATDSDVQKTIGYIANQVTQEKQSAYTQQAKDEIMNTDKIDDITDEVLDKYKDKYVEQAKNKIVTDDYTNEIKDEVLEYKKDKYVEDAKNKYSKTIDGITDEIADVIKDVYIKPAYEYAVDQVSAKYPEDVDETKYGAAMVAINPDNQASDQYTDNNEPVPEEYINLLTDYIKDDILAWEDGKPTNTLSDYVITNERNEFRHDRAYNAISFLIAANLTDEENKQKILDELADYDVDEEEYDSMGFDYDYIKSTAYESMEEYQDKVNYEVGKLSKKLDKTIYDDEVRKIKDDLLLEVGGSLLDKLPGDVTDGIKELGTMDLYGLIVGSIFFKMAGLLLPIIYVIMVSNNLISSQIDTGSMAYILSTSTRRKQVTYTQALYLIGSVALMFILTCITSIVCFNIADVNTKLTNIKIIYLNIAAFATMFAISGINFFASCYFDRSKRAMALGGGISMFFLVTTILGLFGSPVIPSVVRIAPLNYFNYVSIISLFDVIAILDGGLGWIYKTVILMVIGVVGYITGSIIFKKKDLPL